MIIMPPAVDLSLEELVKYKPPLTLKDDFEFFWKETINETKTYPLNSELVPFDYPIKEIRVFNAYYDGYKGSRINGWYILPFNACKSEKVPVIIHYHGYTGHKGYIQEYLKWLIQGFAVFAVSVRGQGSATPDPASYSQGGIRGWLTNGILNKNEYYYKNVYMDCVRAIDFVCEREDIDTSRIGIYGESQGGGLTLAVAGLDSRPRFAMPVYPFLCHFRRAMEMYQADPYNELYDYFRMFDPEMKTEKQVFDTLSYFDCMNLATRIKCPVMMALTLRDIICPPSTQFAAYNRLEGIKECKIYPHHGHEDLPFHSEAMIDFAQRYMK